MLDLDVTVTMVYIVGYSQIKFLEFVNLALMQFCKGRNIEKNRKMLVEP